MLSNVPSNGLRERMQSHICSTFSLLFTVGFHLWIVGCLSCAWPFHKNANWWCFSGFWSPSGGYYHEHPQTYCTWQNYIVVALFALIRILTPQRTCLDRFCSSLASPPSPTTSYASCTSSSSICPIISASALSAHLGQGQPSHESWHWCGAPPSSSPSHYSLELHMGRLCSYHYVLLCSKHTHFHFSFCMLLSYYKVQAGGWNVSNLGGGNVLGWSELLPIFRLDTVVRYHMVRRK